MEMFATDLERLAFLLEADAALAIDPDELGTDAAEQKAPEQAQPDLLGSASDEPDASAASKTEKDMPAGAPGPPEKRPKYITNYIGSKQKLVDWIWRNTPDGVSSVLDAFSGSAVVAYMYKSSGFLPMTVFATVITQPKPSSRTVRHDCPKPRSKNCWRTTPKPKPLFRTISKGFSLPKAFTRSSTR